MTIQNKLIQAHNLYHPLSLRPTPTTLSSITMLHNRSNGDYQPPVSLTSFGLGKALVQLKDDLVDEGVHGAAVRAAHEHAPVVGVALGGHLVPHGGPVTQLQHHLHCLHSREGDRSPATPTQERGGRVTCNAYTGEDRSPAPPTQEKGWVTCILHRLHRGEEVGEGSSVPPAHEGGRGRCHVVPRLLQYRRERIISPARVGRCV